MEKGGGVPGGLWWVHLIFLAVALAMLYGPSLWSKFRYGRYLRAQA
jgi:lipopolysaccharide export system permease protein